MKLGPGAARRTFGRGRAGRACALWGVVLARPAAAAEEGLEIVPDPWTLVALMALFALLIPVVNRLLLRPLLAVLDERDARIRGARERADRLTREAAQVAGRYESAVGEVRTEAERERQSQLAGAREREAEWTRKSREEAARRVEAARAEIDASLERARGTLRSGIDALARDAAERMLGRPVS